MRIMLTLMIMAQIQKQMIQTLPVNQSHDNTIVMVSVLQVWLPYAGKLGHLVLIAANEAKGVWLNRQYYRFGAHINSCIIRIAPMPNTLPENLSIVE